MSLTPLSLVIFAAVAHASWNFFAKTTGGGATFVALVNVLSALLYLPVMAIAVAAGANPPTGRLILVASVSGAIHGLYFLTLQRGYRDGDLSVVYPLARGTGPLIASTVAILFLGDRPSPLGAAGAGAIVAATLALGASAGSGRPGRRAVALAVLTGVFIASYTLWDRGAVHEHGVSPIVYYWGVTTTEAVLLAPLLGRRGEVAAVWRRARSEVLAVAVLSPLAYTLVLFALAVASVTYVASARELSIVFGAALGLRQLGEPQPLRRLALAGAVLFGVIALAVG